MKNEKWVKIGECGVDSGQLMIVDPCYVKDFRNDSYTGKKDRDGMAGEFSYSGICGLTIGKEMGGQIKNKIGAEIAVAFSSGWGDGVYPVYARIKDFGKDGGKRVIEVKIVME